MKKMIKNYENRIKEFVLKMVEKPILIKKEKDKYSTSRQEFYASNSNKILYKRGFQFKSYKSDKERINEILKGKESLDKYLIEIEKMKKKRELKMKKRKEPKLIQPSMRFTARTDLERVYDILKKREHLFEEEKIVRKQLEQIGFATHVIDDDEDENDEYGQEKEDFLNVNNNTNEELMSEEERNKKEIHDKIIQERKNMINKRKFLLHLDHSKLSSNKVKHLREELYQRTHFKAMENLTMFRTSTIDHNIFRNWRKEDKENQYNLKIKDIFDYNNTLYNGNTESYSQKLNKMSLRKKNTYDDIKNTINIKSTDYINYNNNLKVIPTKNDDIFHKASKSTNDKVKYNLTENKKMLEDLEITKEIANSNPLLYNLNFNSIKNENINPPWTLDQLNILKKMAFQKDKMRDIQDETFPSAMFGRNDFDDLRKEENVIIDGKLYKKSDIYEIADKVLQKCHYNGNKVKYKRNEGGLMFTNGLSVKEFEAKYGL
jgi:hypothetical protein